MAVYDKYYQSENYFGEPYSELIRFFDALPRGTLLDMGCGQGRDSIALARLGFQVTGIDSSSVGIGQMNQKARTEGLSLEGVVGDICQFDRFGDFQYILFDSIFHFTRKELQKEAFLIHRAMTSVKDDTMIIFCIQAAAKKIKAFDQLIREHSFSERTDADLVYTFRDMQSKHESKTTYRMISIRK